MVTFFTLFIALVVVNIALLLFSVLRAKGFSFPYREISSNTAKPRILSLNSKRREYKEAI